MFIKIEVPDKSVVTIYVWFPNYCTPTLKNHQKLLLNTPCVTNTYN